jgi:hypothetical protein
MIEHLKSWLNLAEIGQSRSSITNPLQWMMVILLGGILILWTARVPPWVVIVLTTCLVLVVALFIYSYVFFMHTHPDVLRSEQYHLSKMALERGLVGDSTKGLFDSDKAQAAEKLLAAKAPDEEPHQ